MQNWKCKECWSDFIRYDTIRNICWTCLVEKSKQKPLFKNTKPIKARSSKNKNTIAKFSEVTKKKIKARDIDCINCWDVWSEYHHVYFWANAERWPERNNPEKWVFLCKACHHEIHHWTTWQWKIIRARCILHIANLIKS